MHVKYLILLRYCTPIMFACFVCAFLSLCAHNFPEKSITREPKKIIVEYTSYGKDPTKIALPNAIGLI